MAVIISFGDCLWKQYFSVECSSVDLKRINMTRAHIYRYYLAIHKKTEIILTSFLRTPNENKQTNKQTLLSFKTRQHSKDS